MTKLIKIITLCAMATVATAHVVSASPLVYRPINPSFGGDPINGNWLLAYAQGQRKGSSDAPGFTIDFPDFGDIGQDGITNPTPLPPADPQ